MNVLGIDIGGTGTKGAVVNTITGELLTERIRFETPTPATIDNLGKIVRQMKNDFKWNGPIGIGFPSVIQNGIIKTASNIDKSCIGRSAENDFMALTQCPVEISNDADAAALAEMRLGAGRNQNGLIMLITVGTGIGTSVFFQGNLLPNLELGHIYLSKGQNAEKYISDATRKKEELDWETWTKRFNEYMKHLEKVINPSLFIIGGGICKKLDKFAQYLKFTTPYLTAQLENNAGIVGAAIAASVRFPDYK